MSEPVIEPFVANVLFGIGIYGMVVFCAASAYQFRRKKLRSAWMLAGFGAVFVVLVAIGIARRI